MLENPAEQQPCPRQEPIYIRLPREWLVTCVVRPWAKSPYIVSHNGVSWTIGHVPAAQDSPKSIQMPGWFDWKVFFAVLVEYWNDKNSQNLSCRKIARSLRLVACGKSVERIRSAIIALSRFWVKREGGDTTSSFPLLVAKVIQRERGYHFVQDFCLSPEFIAILDKDANRLPVRFDVARRFAGELAGGLYLWLPSRAAAAERSKSGSQAQISLKILGATLGLENVKPWRLKQFLKQGKHPVLRQLDGMPMNEGIFHICLVRAKNGGDKLLLSMKPIASLQSRTDSQLLNAYLKTGRSREAFWEDIRSSTHILDAVRKQRLADIGLGREFHAMCEQACRLLTPYASAYDDIVREVMRQTKSPKCNIPALPLLVTMLRLAVSNLPENPESAVPKWWYAPVHEHMQKRRSAIKAAIPRSMPTKKGGTKLFISQTPKSTVSNAKREAIRHFEDECRRMKIVSTEEKCQIAAKMLPKYLRSFGWNEEESNDDGCTHDLGIEYDYQVEKCIAEYQESLRPPRDKASMLYKGKTRK